MAFSTIDKSSLYQNTVLYTGDTSSSRSITGVGFQPDLVWVKTRNAANPHLLSDSVRGTNNNLQADSDAIASTSYAQGWVSAFGADGYTAQAGGSGDNDINGNTNTYASWNWKANGAGSANTDGSINSTVSVNTTAGFSIVKWTGNVTSGATVGHGLGATPKMIIVTKADDKYIEYIDIHSDTQKKLKIERPIGEDLIQKGSSNHLKMTGSSKFGSADSKKLNDTLKKNLDGKKGSENGKHKPKDYEYVTVSIQGTGKDSGDTYSQGKSYGWEIGGMDKEGKMQIRTRRKYVKDMKKNKAFKVLNVK